ncbi:MAG: hypothetical protein IJ400_06050 [Clostridia bacterium]|nr:hypothetical protein [Clostridia bacterium]
MNNCSSCGKPYSQTLTSFLGVECCPHCHKGTFPSKNTILKITPESRSFYAQAERLFKEGYLLEGFARFGFKKKEEALERAVEKNKHAGLILHDPYALNLHALFYENGYVKDTNDKTVSWKKALTLYETVGLNEEKDNSFKCYSSDNERLSTVSQMETREKYEIQHKACIGILRLLKNTPHRFKNDETISIVKGALKKLDEISSSYPKMISKVEKSLIESTKDTYNNDAPKKPNIIGLEKITDLILDIVADKSKFFMLVANVTKEAFCDLCDYKRKIVRKGEEIHFGNAIKKEGLLIYAGAMEKDDIHKNPITFLNNKRGFVAMSDYNNEHGKELTERTDIDIYFTIIAIDMAKMLKACGKKSINRELDDILKQIENNNSKILDSLSKSSAYSEYSFTTDDLILAKEKDPIKAIEKIIERISEIH